MPAPYELEPEGRNDYQTLQHVFQCRVLCPHKNTLNHVFEYCLEGSPSWLSLQAEKTETRPGKTPPQRDAPAKHHVTSMLLVTIVLATCYHNRIVDFIFPTDTRLQTIVMDDYT